MTCNQGYEEKERDLRTVSILVARVLACRPKENRSVLGPMRCVTRVARSYWPMHSNCRYYRAARHQLSITNPIIMVRTYVYTHFSLADI